MSEQHKSGFCERCQKQGVVFRKRPNHILHLILSVLTGGIWIIVWLLLSLKVGGWRCAACGSEKIKNVI